MPRITARPNPFGPSFFTQLSDRSRHSLKHVPRSVGAAIVHHDDLVRDAVAAQLFVQVLDGGSYRRMLVTSGNHDAETCERAAPRAQAIALSQSGSASASQSGGRW